MKRIFLPQFFAGSLGVALVAGQLAAQTITMAPAPLPRMTDVAYERMAEEAEEAVGEEEEEEDELDFLDKDLSEIRNTATKATALDPEITGVSKKAESISEAPGIVDVITAKDIEEFGAKNLYEVLQWATSVYMTGDFLFRRNNMSIRGDLAAHQNNHVLVLINGRPTRETTQGGVDYPIYAAFPIHMVHHIEVMRGPGSVLYGTNAYAGVVNIVTKNPDSPTAHGSALAGSDGFQKYSLSVGEGNEQNGFYAGADYIRQKGWDFTATGIDPPGPGVQATETVPWGEDNIGAFAMYRQGDFTANVFVADSKQEIMGTFPAWAYISAPSMVMESKRIFCDLGYDLDIGEYQSLALNFSYNYGETTWPGVISTPGNPIPYLAAANSYLMEATYHAELTDKLDLMVGGTVDVHTGQAAMGPAVPISPFEETWYGVYLQMDYEVNDWLTMVGGVQGNLPGEIPGGAVPRAGAIVSMTDNITAKFLYGQAFRSPYQIERSMVVPGVLMGNSALKPETVQTFDFQLSYHTDKFRLAATYYHSDYFEMISRVGHLPETYQNAGTMEFQGVELENEWQVSEQLRWLGSVTYQDNDKDGVHGTTLVPFWQAKMGMSVRPYNGWNVALFNTFYGTPPPTSLNNPAVLVVNPEPAAYNLMSLNATVDLDKYLHWHSGRKVQLQFMIQNLLNERIDHPEFETEAVNSLMAGTGRTFYGGVAMEY